MKSKEELAKYRIKGDSASKGLFEVIGVNAEYYMVPMNGNQCKVIISNELGDTHLSASVEIPETLARLPSFWECLLIKELFFEKEENVVFGISHNRLMNMIVSNPFTMHMYKYDGPMPPVKKIMEIDHYKVDGDYKITKGKGWGWHFIRICGEHYPDMDEIQNIKKKYAPDMDVAIFLIEDAVILFSNPKSGISFHFHTMK